MMIMRINLFKLVEVEYDERIREEIKDIRIKMLLLVQLAFCVTLLLDALFHMRTSEKAPILYYTLLLLMTIEPFLRCLKGTFEDSKIFKFDIISGCFVAGFAVLQIITKLLFSENQMLIPAVAGIATSILTYFIYVLAYNFYLKKQDKE